jgi:uncharacterized protein YecE (DUF72 family)
MSKSHYGDIRVGISGWRYVPWRGTFYPKGLVQKNELHFASRCVNTIEINGSFYALQTPERYANWYEDVPDDFIFSVKAPRYVTHIKRLRDVQEPIANFFASGILELKEKLGPILWQFPPTFKFDKDLFKQFLELLPMDRHAAELCAKQSTSYERSHSQKADSESRLRHAVEIRNESFKDDEFIKLLRHYGVALVIADTAGRWPQIEEITSDFVYMRLHGDAELYRSGYSDEALDRWYSRMTLWREGKQPTDAKLIMPERKSATARRDVYCYFDNTDKLWAPYDARKILEKFDLAKNLEETPGILNEHSATSKQHGFSFN